MGKDVAIEHQLVSVVDYQSKRMVVVQWHENAIQKSIAVAPQMAEVAPFSCFAGDALGTPASFEIVSVVEVQK